MVELTGITKDQYEQYRSKFPFIEQLIELSPGVPVFSIETAELNQNVLSSNAGDWGEFGSEEISSSSYAIVDGSIENLRKYRTIEKALEEIGFHPNYIVSVSKLTEHSKGWSDLSIKVYEWEMVDVVDENDNVLDITSLYNAHKEGLRHRSVQILIAKKKKLLIAKRSSHIEHSKEKYHLSAGGHVKSQQSYLDAAMAETHEELFFRKDMPDLEFEEIGRYKNDTRPNNKENTRLYVVNHPGPFFPDPHEISELTWKRPKKLWKKRNESYTNSLVNALNVYLEKQK
jgi:isopentenyldiphosphate isomerase